MAYLDVSTLGYNLSSGNVYTGITDSSADWGSVPNDTFFLDKATNRVYYKDATGTILDKMVEVIPENRPSILDVKNYLHLLG